MELLETTPIEIRRRHRSRRRWVGIVTIVVLVVIGVLYLSPVIWLVLSSFKTRVDLFSQQPLFIFQPTFENYIQAFGEKGFLDNLANSAIVAALSTLVALAVGVPAAYSISRRPRGGGLIMLLLLTARLLPAMVLAVPLFTVMSNLGLTDTYLGVVAAHLTFSIPFTVWMMHGFFAAVPTSIDEAAKLDGCSDLRTFFTVIMPLTKGGIAAAAVFCVVNSWNEFLFALVLTGRATQTLPVALPGLITPLGTFWGQIGAVGTVTIIPVAVFAFFVQKHMVAGLTGGAISAD